MSQRSWTDTASQGPRDPWLRTLKSRASLQVSVWSSPASSGVVWRLLYTASVCHHLQVPSLHCCMIGGWGEGSGEARRFKSINKLHCVWFLQLWETWRSRSITSWIRQNEYSRPTVAESAGKRFFIWLFYLFLLRSKTKLLRRCHTNQACYYPA